jgi:hypothetical protein
VLTARAADCKAIVGLEGNPSARIARARRVPRSPARVLQTSSESPSREPW